MGGYNIADSVRWKIRGQSVSLNKANVTVDRHYVPRSGSRLRNNIQGRIYGAKRAMAPKMPNIVQHDTETTQSWCALQ